ncbi:MAG: glyoxalase family protein [Actinomycetota bacterium]|jgi:glyoxalase family protein|nr:glyoxalase family protein [Actinomycetota bacterium]
MELEGIHHVTAITGDAPGNVEFYAGVLGLRLVKKTVNQDDPTVYHLFYADEKGSAGSDITFFEYPGVPRGRAGDGMVHRVDFRIGAEAMDFWQQRLVKEGITVARDETALVFDDPEGLTLGFVVDTSGDEPLRADTPGIPSEMAIRGFDGVHAYASDPTASRSLFEDSLNFKPESESSWIARGAQRGGHYRFDEAPEARPLSGAGTVHHVAWASPMDEHDAWRERVRAAGANPTPVIDRFYFRSIYFREPSGVLFEIATLGPGFAADEDLATLGEALSLPPNFEHLRDKLKDVLTVLPNPRRRAEAES